MSAPYAQKTKLIFNECLRRASDPKYVHQDGATVKQIFDNFALLDQYWFPTLGLGNPEQRNVPHFLGTFLGTLKRELKLSVFVTSSVNTNWKRPQVAPGTHKKSYLLYLDQPTLAYDAIYYKVRLNETEELFSNSAFDAVTYLAKLKGITVDEEEVKRDIAGAWKVEKFIAQEVNVGAEEKRKYERSYNIYTAGAANEQFKFLDFHRFLIALAASSNATKLVQTPGFEFNVNEPAAFKKLADHLQKKVAKRDLMNYINFRVLLAVKSLLPEANIDNFEFKSQRQRGFNIGLKKGFQPRRPLPIPFPEPEPMPSPGTFSAMAVDYNELRCALGTAIKASAATTRIYLDEALPKANRKEVKSKVALLVNNVIEGFQYQLDRLNWMSTESKKNAYDKINYLVKNLVYPEWVEDDDKLDEYYKDLDLDADQDYLDFTASLTHFEQNKEFSLLASEGSVERDDFLMSMALVNAWYQPEVNSITIPYGILQAPFFHVDQPMAANLGGIGAIAGHELTHGFDDEGSQYDGLGVLRTWMDEKSQKQFDTMAQCVIDQYASFEPFPGLFVDGSNTQGENIADNGGIRAAFNALTSYEAFYGPDPALPDDVLSGFSNQQLFFISFARAWCEMPADRDEIEEQILHDPHSPSKYRVVGSIQNFPAFREAFNCPAKTAYAPAEHCNVWASEVSDKNGVPKTPPPTVDTRIRPIGTNKSEEFNAVSSRVAGNINLDEDPCENFYEYSCRKSDGKKPLEEAEIAVDTAVEKFLATTKLKDEAVEKARKFLKSCESAEDSRIAIHTVIQEVEAILRVHINFTHPSFNALNPSRLVGLAYLFSYKYDVDLFFHLNLRPNLKKEVNTAPYLLYLEQPELLLKPEVYKSTSAWKITKEFEEYTTGLVKAYYKTDEDISSVIRSSLKIEEQLASFISEENDVTDDNFNLKSLTELAKDYPKLRLQDYFLQITKNEGIFVQGLTAYLKNHHTKIVNTAANFLEKFSNYVENLSGRNTDDLIRYIALKAILKLQRFAPREHNQLSLEVREALDQEIFALPSNGKSCLKELHHFLPVQYTTAATLGLYSNEKELSARQRDVAKIADYVFIEFERQLEGVSWMPLSSRQKAIKKVRAVARNIGVPYDVSAYDIHAVEKSVLAANRPVKALELAANKHYLQWSDAVLMKRLNLFSTLLNKQEISRDIFLTYSQRKATPAAQFSHDLNSISLSLAALQSPFYNKDYPMAWNFATVGGLVAEQLAHLFDASGLDHDEFGQLKSWLDAQSKDVVKNQLEELKKQYSTVGLDHVKRSEILAKTLGATLSYRALVSWNDFHGEQSPLSHPIFRNYNSEQLFFLLHAQEYCSPRANRNISLAFDLINSGNFRHVFHCSSASKLGRKQRVALYETDVDGFFGVPNVPTKSPELNIPKAAPEYSQKYRECAAAFENSVDTTADPCTDFYQYTCGNYHDDSPFSDADVKNTIRLLNDIRQVHKGDSKVVALEKLIFAQCKQDLPRFDALNADAKVLKEIVADLESVLGQKFPLTANNTAKALTAEEIGKAMGFLSGKHGIGALLDVMVYTNVRAPEKGYSVYIGSGYYLLEGFMGESEEEIVETVGGLILQYLNAVMDVSNETVANVKEEVKAFVMIEGLLIDSNNPSRRNPRNASERYHQITLKDLLESYPTPINFRSFLEGIVTSVPEAVEKVTSDTFDVGLSDPQNLRSFLEAFEELLARDDLKPQNLINYLFYHVLMLQHGAFLPPAPATFGAAGAKDFYKKLLWERRLPKPETGGINFPESEIPLEKNPRLIAAGITELDIQCMQLVTAQMQEATNALFVEVTYPDKKKRLEDRLGVAKFADSIMVGFRTMLDQLNWMKPESKATAYKKIDLLVKNIAYPNISIDPVKLEDYHKELLDSNIIESTFPYTLNSLLRFNMKQAVKELVKPVYDRSTFGSAFRLNAWYQPAANSITLPASILQQPFYDAEWPDSVNFGSIGAVAGHELVHAFDDSGVQWDPVGRLRSWIDDESFKSFREMADCVVDEYKKFCYPDGQCVDGSHTQGENIADNGGIQAAYRAYRSAVGVNGPDAALPGKLIGQFTFDQLFFLSFGRTWCSGPVSAERRAAILKDVHSPPEFRVFGTLQNFPAFRDAFNCPLKAAYAPEKHCQVWITDIEPSLAVPTPIPPKSTHFKDIKKNQTEIVV
ncbi:unnamed protein product [Bursaphelenchus xylophilus]|uniref:(pine wood nematode) hypothetical protein n=1 Tax=Bursaphelenchus xylophilus TaxID=6326 RepID=A0A1I7RVZ9_BURXY|nr:unnamed protein product [Bursaphelenchus xylophilus]CAG9094938.1 unnamed protein product [Bursaphelenchus xylophilus]